MEFWSRETADLVTFTEEILNGKLHLLRSGFSVELNEIVLLDNNINLKK